MWPERRICDTMRTCARTGGLRAETAVAPDATSGEAKPIATAAVDSQPGLEDQSFRALIECFPVGVLVYRRGVAIYANQRLQEYVGLAADQLVGKPVAYLIETLFAESERAAGHSRLQQTAHGGVLPPVERRLKRADGKLGVAELTSLTVMIAGVPTQLTIVHDLTDRRNMEAQIATADRMATLGRVAAGLTHELNNPLTHLLGSLELARERLPSAHGIIEDLRATLRRADGPADLAALGESLIEVAAHLGAVGGMLSEAAGGARRVRAVMDDFRAVSMPSTAEARPVDVRAALRSALRLAHHQLAEVASVDELVGEVPRVFADESRLCQAIVYLLVDVASHLRQLGLERQPLSVLVGPVAGAVAVEVRAPIVCGIDRLLTAPFSPGGWAAQHTGVQVCGEIVRGYGGQVQPLCESESSGIAIRLPAALERHPTAAPPTSPQVGRGRVLVIDDDRFVASILQRVLVGEHDVTVETKPLAALRLLTEGELFDVVLCDAMMPDLGGLELFARLRDIRPKMAARLVFVTGGAFAENADQMLAETGRPCLGKPFDIARVRQAVAEHVAAARAAATPQLSAL